MKTQELKIEAPKGFEIDTEKSTFERIVFKEVSDKFNKVLAYHNTTGKEFDKQYENIPFHVKAYEKEAMLAAFYNKGWFPNWKDSKERKYYAWFYMDEFRRGSSECYCSYSNFPARLCYKNEKDLLEAIELYPEIFKDSRTS